VVVIRVFLESRTALGTQTRAVSPAHRLERQLNDHCVPKHGFEIDFLVPHFIHLLVLDVLVTFGRGIEHEKFLYVDR